MVVGVAEVGLQEVVVHVLRGELGPHPVQVHRLELQHHHGPGGVLGERLVDPDADLRSGHQLALDEVTGDQLLGDVHRTPVGTQFPGLDKG